MRCAVVVVAVAFLGCSQSVDLHPPVTLLVENTTCASTCTPIHVLAFPHNQFAAPSGPWSVEVGVVTGASACFVLPPNATFSVTEVGGTSKTFTWTLTDSVSLGFAPDGNHFTASPSTAPFVAAGERGWSVKLPQGAEVAASAPCAP